MLLECGHPQLKANSSVCREEEEAQSGVCGVELGKLIRTKQRLTQQHAYYVEDRCGYKLFGTPLV